MTKLFIDTSGFKALVDPEDDFHFQAEQFWDQLAKSSTELITSNFILDETFTLLRARLGLAAAVEFKRALAESSLVLKIVRVTAVDEERAWFWFLKRWRRLSFTDCVSFALMERLAVKDVFSFDQHFTRAGFNRLPK